MKLFRKEPNQSPDEGRNRETRRGGPRVPPPRRAPTPLPPGRPFRTLAFWVFVALLALVAYRVYQGNFMATPRLEISYTRFIQEVERGNILTLQVVEKVVSGDLKAESAVRLSGHEVRFKAFRTNILGDGTDLPDRVWKTNPGIEIEVRQAGFNWLSFLFTSLPFLLLLPLWMVMIRQMQSGGSAALKFGKTKAKVLIESTPKVTFKDVAGCDEAKQELQEIIEFLKEPQKFQRLGGRIPKGALLLGPPGSGKTLLAKAVAGEAHVPFFSMSGSDFVEMFVGVGASRVRDLFEQGKRNAPCLPGDTVITLSGGRQVTIQEMFENAMVGVKVPAMTEDFRFEDATVLGITRKPGTELLRILTSTSEIKATPNHLFPVLRGSGMEWIRADQLTTSDLVAVPRTIGTTPIWPLSYEFLPQDETFVQFRGRTPGRRRARLSKLREEITSRHDDIDFLCIGRGGFRTSYLKRVPLHLTDDIAYLCGLIASDGTYGVSRGRTITFVNTELALHERVREIVEQNFSYAPKRHLNRKHYETILPQGSTPKVLQDCYTTYINNLLLCETLRGVQAHILELPSELIAAWLRGVFDGDGYVRADPRTPQVVISAWDRKSNRMIRDALLRVDIPTSLSSSADAGHGNIYITGLAALTSFVNRVGADHPQKAAKLDQLRAFIRDRTTSASRLDSVPAQGIIRRARLSFGMGQRAFNHGHVVSSYERGVVTPSRASLQLVVEEMDEWRNERGLDDTDEFAQLRDLAHSAVLWSQIQRVDEVQSIQPVYDLCLDRHNCFIANNIIAHNCIVFIDEIDAVGRHRGAGLGGGHDEREQTLNQLLVEMDGFDSNEGVIMVAATNRPDVLDPALLRPGRFDRQIVVDWPDVRGREGIFKVHTRSIPVAEDVDLNQLARATPGMAGADIANMVNEAALLAARRNRKKVVMQDFEDAKDKVMLGTERKSLVMTEDERRSTAYHEAGHALVAWLMPGTDPVDKVTIIPRGRALGLTSYIPSEERHARSREDLVRAISMMMGGRAAEKLIFGHLTTGAANDLERATSLARRMVCELGMSETLGPLTFGKKEEMVFLGREIATHKDYSEQTAIQIDEEVRRIAESCYQQAFELLKNNQDKLHLLATTLLEREVLDGEQMNRLLLGETLEPIRAVEPEPVANEPGDEAQAAKEGERRTLDTLTSPEPRPAGA
ncbi:MAG TPA: AAA family ATPase [Candidatus Eisenbacteria bacterium]